MNASLTLLLEGGALRNHQFWPKPVFINIKNFPKILIFGQIRSPCQNNVVENMRRSKQLVAFIGKTPSIGTLHQELFGEGETSPIPIRRGVKTVKLYWLNVSDKFRPAKFELH